MTVDDALAAVRARWSHGPVDRHDLEERLAVRLRESPSVEAQLLGPWPPYVPACRLFVRHGERFRSRYVHAANELDAALDWCMRAR